MLGISRQTDYAARVVLHLACLAPGARVPIADIAKHRMLPLDFVRRIVGDLVKVGVLATSRGSGDATTRRNPRPASSFTARPSRRSSSARAAS